MFESAVKKLTIWYVGALFAVCLIFSIPAYAIASSRLAHGAVRQTEILENFDRPFGVSPLPDRVVVLRDEQLRRDRQQLLHTIVLANVVILSLGAYFSYQFAKRTLKPIEEAHEAQARFTTDASHELRTPLATMQTEIEVALRDKKFGATIAKKVLVSNLEEIGRLRILSEQLLNLSRLDSGQLHKKSLQLNTLLEKQIKHIEKHVGITIDRSIEQDVTIQGDGQLLGELLTILADNAVKYAGDKPPEVSIKLQKSDDYVLLTVTDHGVGIKATEIPHIFDRFYRGGNASTYHASGHGLGLSLARQIVESHGGAIKVSSEPSKHTTFEISLPG